MIEDVSIGIASMQELYKLGADYLVVWCYTSEQSSYDITKLLRLMWPADLPACLIHLPLTANQWIPEEAACLNEKHKLVALCGGAPVTGASSEGELISAIELTESFARQLKPTWERMGQNLG